VVLVADGVAAAIGGASATTSGDRLIAG
jgi:hypothetical protein